jgi:hypothetical protein
MYSFFTICRSLLTVLFAKGPYYKRMAKQLHFILARLFKDILVDTIHFVFYAVEKTNTKSTSMINNQHQLMNLAPNLKTPLSLTKTELHKCVLRDDL